MSWIVKQECPKLLIFALAVSLCFTGNITELHDTFYFLLRGFKHLSQAEGIRK
jgi:hypothetical protein